MKLSVNQTAKLTGVSVRTLHYYDQIGLLSPSETSEAGYRFYDGKAIAKLQQILFYKELDFPLKEIQKFLTSPAYNTQNAMNQQKHLLELKKQRLERLIGLLDDTMNGGRTMEFQEFNQNELNEARQKYAAETKERWGHTSAYAESEKRTASYTKEEWAVIQTDANRIFKSFAALTGTTPDSAEVQALVKEWQAHITQNYYPCTDEILAGLGEMYLADARFQQNLDAHGAGTAQLMHDAIQAYVRQK